MELLKGVDLKKIGNISFIVAVTIITYYTLSSYKIFLEIKELQKNKE